MDNATRAPWTPPTPNPKPACTCPDKERVESFGHGVNCPVFQWRRAAIYPELIGYQCRGYDCPPPAIPDRCPACAAPKVSHVGRGTFGGHGYDVATYQCGGKYEPKPQCQTHTDKFWGSCPAINADDDKPKTPDQHVPPEPADRRPLSSLAATGVAEAASGLVQLPYGTVAAFTNGETKVERTTVEGTLCVGSPTAASPATYRQQVGRGRQEIDARGGDDTGDTHTYRVWFRDGTAVIVNAYNSDAARCAAREVADANANPAKIERVEQIDAPTPRRKRH